MLGSGNAPSSARPRATGAKANAELAAAAIRTIFAQPDAVHVLEQHEVIAQMLGRQLPKVETMLREAHDDLLAFASFPVTHWKKIWSTDPLDRLNKEVKRRTDVVGVFPNPSSASPARCLMSRPDRRPTWCPESGPEGHIAGT